MDGARRETVRFEHLLEPALDFVEAARPELSAWTRTIFDFGETRVRRARETYLQSVHRLAEMGVNVRSEAREAYKTLRATYDIHIELATQATFSDAESAYEGASGTFYFDAVGDRVDVAGDQPAVVRLLPDGSARRIG
mgnify:CR=1 FL=1